MEKEKKNSNEIHLPEDVKRENEMEKKHTEKRDKIKNELFICAHRMLGKTHREREKEKERRKKK